MARRKRPVLGAACPTSAQNCKAKDRQVDALTLRKQGLTYSAIAEKLGVSKGSAVAYVQKALKELAEECREEAEQVRDLEQIRLDGLYLKSLESLVRAEEIATRLASRSPSKQADIKAWSAAEYVILGAVKECRGIQERRAKLLGLDAPEQINHSGTLTWQEVVESACGDRKD